MLDFALVSVVSLVYYLILRYDKERNLIGAVLLFIAMTAASLVKQTAIIFFIPVTFLLLVTRWPRKKYTWVIVCSAIISILLIAARYFNKIIELFSYNGQFDVLSVTGRLNDHLLWYLNVLRVPIISPMLLIFFVIGLLLLLFIDKRRFPLFILLVWILGSLFILSLIEWKDGRYLVAALPAFAIITAGGINAMPSRPLKGILLSALIPVAFIQFFNLSFGLLPFLVKETDYFYNSSALREDWKIKEILAYIYSRHKNKTIRIGLFPNCEHFNHDEFILYITLNKLPYSIEQLFASKIFAKAIKDCEIVVTKYPFSSIYCSDDKGEAEFYQNSIRETLRKNRFKNIASFDLPDNSKGMIYEMEPESH